MIRHVLALCVLLVPTIAAAQTPVGTGAPVVFFSIFGPNGSELQRFYADVFEWKVAASGDVAPMVTPPLLGTIAQGAPETIVYVGVADVTATLQKGRGEGRNDSLSAVRSARPRDPGRLQRSGRQQRGVGRDGERQGEGA